MKLRPVAIAASAAVIGVGALSAVILPAEAAQRPAPTRGSAAGTADLAPAMLAAMQRDLGLTASQARTRIRHEDAAARTASQLSQKLGARFGGAWLTADGATLVVGVTSEAQAAEVRAAGARAKLVRRGVQQLDAAHAKLDKMRSKARGVAGWYVDPATNSVVVTAKTTAAAKTFAAAAGVDAAAVRVEVSAETPVLFADVRGGDAYYINNSGRCSIGFSVSGGYVTAGHCGRSGASTTGVNRAAQGTFAGSSFPGNDYAWVRVNSNWTPRGVVNNYSGGTVNVTGSQEAPIGSSVCRSGSTTGWHCGTIQARNATVNYAQGSVSGLTRTNACAEPGDSGGSWITGTQAQGVTSGGSGNCRTGGTTFFQPVNEILGAYGLTLTTAGGGEPPAQTSTFVSVPSGRCLDVAAQTNSTGARLWDCNGNANQKWAVTAAGELRLGANKCLDAAGTAGGSRAIVWDCHGGTNQKWTINSNGTITSRQSGMCLDAWNNGTANGTAVNLWSCHGGANQKWTRR